MSSIKISNLPTKASEGLSKKEAEKSLDKIAREIADYKEMLMADGGKSLLIVMQGMDSSGKDSAIKKAFQYCSPVGLGAYSFKKPTDEEMNHDFLWRVHRQTPQKGEVKVFLRSHYEDILIQRVHGWIDMDRVKFRMKAINQFEELLQVDANTTVLKFFLNISYETQEKELMQRVQESDKHWKHNDGDWNEREHWAEYMKAYEYVLNESDIPWNVIPVDDRWYKNYAIAKRILATLKDMNLSYPKLETDREEWKKFV